MASWLPLTLFFIFLFGTTLLVLIAGFQSREAERAEHKAEQATSGIPTGVDSLFSPLGSGSTRRVSPGVRLDDLERHLRTQRTVAAAFVSDPSLETLFERPRGAVHARVAALERHLGRERGVVSRFAARPSLRGLFPKLSDAQLAAVGVGAEQGSGRLAQTHPERLS